MPGGDRTGPAGLGPMTGRAAGYCAGYPVPGYMNPTVGGRGFGRGRGGWGRGFGRGRGQGWGRGRGWYGDPYSAYPPPYAQNNPYSAYPSPYAQNITAQQETDMLKEEAGAMKEEIKAIEERIKELGTKTTGQKK